VVLKEKQIDLKNLTLSELEKWIGKFGEPKFRAHQIFEAIYKHNIKDIFSITTLSKSLRSHLAEICQISSFQSEETLTASDGTIKFLFRLKDGQFIESVLIPQSGYYTLCVSTQVGCAMGCKFCLTGKMGFKRNLETAEIINQVLYAKEHLPQPWPLRNIVFMGMGEPLHNFEATLKAVNILTHPLGLKFSHRRVTISTIGLAPQMLKFSQKVNVSWAISFHAADNKTRNFLVPINKKYPLEVLIKTMHKMPLPKRKRFTIAYVLLRGVNTSVRQAKDLAKLLKGLPVKINLIPFNPCPDIDFSPPLTYEILQFQEVLQKYGYTVTIRQSKGADIGAACGQLDGKPREFKND